MDTADKELLSWLRAAIADRRLTQLEVSRATGVHQSQISRILKGEVKRASENVTALCRYAAEASRRTSIPQEVPAAARARALLDELMNGSAEEQRAIAELLAQLVVARNASRRRRKREA
ncbi:MULTISPECIES: helix-turn-helix domain-containing protein [Burkholderia]|uniref:helix-turn-helix domain-containing protein n=1 Tax=Burkholderia TaxID=32008 RepID=UPI0013A698D7|nr:MULTISPECIES: helix-turn-helix transcriptional regulator [Burkholderia]MCM2482397.1 helix-turn-helix transcriptional regulator [Burkholderia glumae]MCM2507459.1 helix-turn-helix transcriptional regulator [Burkholderia glumae]HDR9090195.1 helix-turn-helix transcriptional regulator [Burkholderia vietnamiensis]